MFFLGKLNADSILEGSNLVLFFEFLIIFSGSYILSDQMLYQTETTSSKLTEKTQFQTRIQIDGFHSFVSSKAT